MKRITAIAAGLALAMAGATGAYGQSGDRGHRAHVSPGCFKRSCADRVWRKSHPRHAAVRSTISSADQQWLYNTRMCESGGNYATDTGNGFYGAYQFTLSSWQAVGGSGNPAAAPPWEQDMRALRLRNASGTGNWPVCG